jgi:Domain of unknown function (DUF4157)
VQRASSHAQLRASGRDVSEMTRTRPTTLQQSLPGLLGNQAMLRTLGRTAPRMQCKLEIGAVNDPLEAEADRIADHVLRMPDPSVATADSPHALQRKCAECEEEEAHTVRPKREASHATAQLETPDVVYAALRGSGQSLDPQTRSFFEARLGRDFSQVRIHVDSIAETSARAVKATAYTVGSDVVFAAGRYAPHSSDGRRLLAHELAHVVQQRAAGPSSAARQSLTAPGASDPTSGAMLRRSPGPGSPDYVQGYQDGLSGEPSHAIPRAGDALEDYDEGYLKGQYEFKQKQAAPVPAQPAPIPAAGGVSPAPPAGGQCSSAGTGSVTLCNRDFAGKVAGALVPARHCFVWGHPAGTNATPATIDPNATDTYDPTHSGTPDAETAKKGTECLQTYDVDPDCVHKKYQELCKATGTVLGGGQDFNLLEHNCCSCARDALTACGAKVAPQDFPAENQGIGLPDSYGSGWKKNIVKGLQDKGQCLIDCQQQPWYLRGFCAQACDPGPYPGM